MTETQNRPKVTCVVEEARHLTIRRAPELRDIQQTVAQDLAAEAEARREQEEARLRELQREAYRLD